MFCIFLGCGCFFAEIKSSLFMFKLVISLNRCRCFLLDNTLTSDKSCLMPSLKSLKFCT